MKGHTNNPNGRPKGSQNRITKELKGGIMSFLENNWHGVQADFDQLEPRDKLTFILKLLEYALPKQRSIDSNLLLESKIDALSDEKEELIINQILEENE